MSMLFTTIVVALCRRKSTRITAVLGGLVLALGILFTSFATQFHQVAFSYGTVLSFVIVPRVVKCCSLDWMVVGSSGWRLAVVSRDKAMMMMNKGLILYRILFLF